MIEATIIAIAMGISLSFSMYLLAATAYTIVKGHRPNCLSCK